MAVECMQPPHPLRPRRIVCRAAGGVIVIAKCYERQNRRSRGTLAPAGCRVIHFCRPRPVRGRTGLRRIYR
jgi:hypothetical protein